MLSQPEGTGALRTQMLPRNASVFAKKTSKSSSSETLASANDVGVEFGVDILLVGRLLYFWSILRIPLAFQEGLTSRTVPRTLRLTSCVVIMRLIA